MLASRVRVTLSAQLRRGGLGREARRELAGRLRTGSLPHACEQSRRKLAAAQPHAKPGRPRVPETTRPGAAGLATQGLGAACPSLPACLQPKLPARPLPRMEVSGGPRGSRRDRQAGRRLGQGLGHRRGHAGRPEAEQAEASSKEQRTAGLEHARKRTQAQSQAWEGPGGPEGMSVRGTEGRTEHGAPEDRAQPPPQRPGGETLTAHDRARLGSPRERLPGRQRAGRRGAGCAPRQSMRSGWGWAGGRPPRLPSPARLQALTCLLPAACPPVPPSPLLLPPVMRSSPALPAGWAVRASSRDPGAHGRHSPLES